MSEMAIFRQSPRYLASKASNSATRHAWHTKREANQGRTILLWSSSFQKAFIEYYRPFVSVP